MENLISGMNKNLNRGREKTMSGKSRIYLVEDEADIAELVKYNLNLEDYEVEVFTDGEAGYTAIAQNTPDLVLLDLMLPNLDGLEICRKMKSDEKLKMVPILMLTAKGEDRDIVLGLESGADDYLVKPFSPKVLAARVEAVLRRARRTDKVSLREIQRGNLKIIHDKHQVLVDEKPLSLTHSEFEILSFLAKRPGWVFTRSQIVDAIRGQGYAVTDRAIDFQMVGLRKKLGTCAHLIETVRGVGYRFQETT